MKNNKGSILVSVLIIIIIVLLVIAGFLYYTNKQLNTILQNTTTQSNSLTRSQAQDMLNQYNNLMAQIKEYTGSPLSDVNKSIIKQNGLIVIQTDKIRGQLALGGWYIDENGQLTTTPPKLIL